MEEKIIQLHAEICKCLASPVRLKVLNVLRKGEKSVDVLAKILRVQKAKVNKLLLDYLKIFLDLFYEVIFQIRLIQITK